MTDILLLFLLANAIIVNDSAVSRKRPTTVSEYDEDQDPKVGARRAFIVRCCSGMTCTGEMMTNSPSDLETTPPVDQEDDEEDEEYEEEMLPLPTRPIRPVSQKPKSQPRVVPQTRVVILQPPNRVQQPNIIYVQAPPKVIYVQATPAQPKVVYVQVTQQPRVIVAQSQRPQIQRRLFGQQSSLLSLGTNMFLDFLSQLDIIRIVSDKPLVTMQITTVAGKLKTSNKPPTTPRKTDKITPSETPIHDNNPKENPIDNGGHTEEIENVMTTEQAAAEVTVTHGSPDHTEEPNENTNQVPNTSSPSEQSTPDDDTSDEQQHQPEEKPHDQPTEIKELVTPGDEEAIVVNKLKLGPNDKLRQLENNKLINNQNLRAKASAVNNVISTMKSVTTTKVRENVVKLTTSKTTNIVRHIIVTKTSNNLNGKLQVSQKQKPTQNEIVFIQDVNLFKLGQRKVEITTQTTINQLKTGPYKTNQYVKLIAPEIQKTDVLSEMINDKFGIIHPAVKHSFTISPEINNKINILRSQFVITFKPNQKNKREASLRSDFNENSKTISSNLFHGFKKRYKRFKNNANRKFSTILNKTKNNSNKSNKTKLTAVKKGAHKLRNQSATNAVVNSKGKNLKKYQTPTKASILRKSATKFFTNLTTTSYTKLSPNMPKKRYYGESGHLPRKRQNFSNNETLRDVKNKLKSKKHSPNLLKTVTKRVVNLFDYVPMSKPSFKFTPTLQKQPVTKQPIIFRTTKRVNQINFLVTLGSFQYEKPKKTVEPTTLQPVFKIVLPDIKIQPNSPLNLNVFEYNHKKITTEPQVLKTEKSKEVKISFGNTFTTNSFKTYDQFQYVPFERNTKTNPVTQRSLITTTNIYTKTTKQNSTATTKKYEISEFKILSNTSQSDKTKENRTGSKGNRKNKTGLLNYTTTEKSTTLLYRVQTKSEKHSSSITVKNERNSTKTDNISSSQGTTGNYRTFFPTKYSTKDPQNTSTTSSNYQSISTKIVKLTSSSQLTSSNVTTEDDNDD